VYGSSLLKNSRKIKTFRSNNPVKATPLNPEAEEFKVKTDDNLF